MNLSDVVRLKQASEDNGPLELTDPLEKTDFMNMREGSTCSGFDGEGSYHRRQ